MTTKKLILASSSPRRKQLLSLSGIPLTVLPADILEEQRPGESPRDYTLRNCVEKALCIAQKLQEEHFILAADTIVVSQDGLVLEKPKDSQHAFQMLSSLSGRQHTVISGYALFKNTQELSKRVVTTSVTFRPLSPREITAYIATQEPYDKSGAYGIQGKAMGFVEKIEGSYTNVMGLPLSEVLQDLEKYAHILSFSCESSDDEFGK